MFRRVADQPLDELNDHEVSELVSVESVEEEQFIRGGLFKKLVPQIYNSTCCITGMRLISNRGFSMIDACHIEPYSVSKIDKVTNGIALCPNLHRAFDRGLVGIDENRKILISKFFAEDESNSYSLKALEGKMILPPFGNLYYPNQSHFDWHRKFIFEK